MRARPRPQAGHTAARGWSVIPGAATARRASAIRRARSILALVAVALLALTSCSSGATVTEVTVTVGQTSIVLPPALACAAPGGGTELTCAGGEDDTDAPHLALAAGTPITIDVPDTVAKTPWVVVFTGVDADGTPRSDRTAVFPPDEKYSYRLDAGAGTQLTRVEVQSLIAAPSAEGGVEFPAIGTWVLVVDPVVSP